MKIYNLFCFLFLTFLIIFSGIFSYSAKAQEIYLSDLPIGFIANEFGPPNKDLSWNSEKMTIHGKVYQKGLGVHAPSQICLDINGDIKELSAEIGMDDGITVDALSETSETGSGSIQERPMARFIIKGEGNTLFSSGWMTENSDPIPVKVALKDIDHLCLIVENGPSGPDEVLANWADIRITPEDPDIFEKLILYHHPPDILLNHGGYTSSTSKVFRIAGNSGPDEFSVIRTSTNEEVITGNLEIIEGDWGTLKTGDFSSIREPGEYFLKIEDRVSIPFSIHRLQYIKHLNTHLNWFLWQRCGDPYNGWERGQHQDDGVRLDNHRHQDVSGGWHDAADLRKWGMTINGLWALSEIYLTLSDPSFSDFAGKRDMILKTKDELAWGNKYFQAMQEPEGYLMNQVGGDVYDHGDNNRFTDNIPGSPDDRWIVTTPNAPVFQFMFVISQCNISLAEDRLPENPYTEKAERCFQWAMDNKIVSNIHELAAALTASLKLYQVTGDQKYEQISNNFLKILLSRQNTDHRPFYGFMAEWDPENPDKPKTYPTDHLSYQLITPNFPIWAVVESIKYVSDENLRKRAENAFTRWVDHFIKYFDQKSSYGIVPMALYTEDPGGNRKDGDYFYRWCYVNRENNDWWNGINPRIGYAGACLVRGGLLTGNKEAIRIGQQQIDFIYGCNPFNASTVTGIGHNQPEYFKTSEFIPHTPLIEGAVMAGIGSSNEDLPVVLPEWWQTTEYWMEAVCGTIMLLNELNRLEHEKK